MIGIVLGLGLELFGDGIVLGLALGLIGELQRTRRRVLSSQAK